MQVFKEILDKQLYDQRGIKCGKVDGVVFEYPDDGPPRIARLEVGPAVLGNRLGERIGRWVTSLAKRWGPQHAEPFPIEWSQVRRVVENGVHIALDYEKSELVKWEYWLREKVVCKIPGAG